MTRVARGARQAVVVAAMAVRALTGWNRMRTRQLKAGAVVIKRRVQPRTRVVALIATLGEIRRHVVRIRRPLIVLQMATHAGASGQVVVVGDVAISALTRWHGMHPG